MNSGPEVWLWLLSPSPTPAPLLFWSQDKQTLPIHHLTGSSQISGQSHGSLGAAGDVPQMVSGFLTGPVSPHPHPQKPHMLLRFRGSMTSRSLASLRHVQPLGGQCSLCREVPSPLLRAAGPAESGVQRLRGNVVPT